MTINIQEEFETNVRNATKLVERLVEEGDIDADSSYMEITSAIVAGGFSPQVAHSLAVEMGRTDPRR